GSGCDFGDDPQARRPPRDTSPEAKYQRVLVELDRVLSADPNRTGGRSVMASDAGSATTTTKYRVSAPESISVPDDGSAPTVSVDITQVSTYSFLPAPKK